MLALLQTPTVIFFTVVGSTEARCSVLLRQSFCIFVRVMGLVYGGGNYRGLKTVVVAG